MSWPLRDTIAPFYQDEACTIYCGDWLKIAPAVMEDPADHIITDPPYDERTHAKAKTHFRPDQLAIEFDHLKDLASIVKALLTYGEQWIIAFCAMEQLGFYQAAAGENYVRGAFWHRKNGAPQFTGDRPGQPGEGIAVLHGKHSAMTWNGCGKAGFYSTAIEHSERVHPTQKPITLMRQIVDDFTTPGQLILDPYMGSGTTLVAAKERGRRAIGCEINESYCAAAVKRLRQGILL